MSGPNRNPDSMNTIGIVVVGICGAVMVYVTITALQAFYMKDTAEVQTMADYGGQDTTAKSHKADELRNITVSTLDKPILPIDKAMDFVVAHGTNPAHLVPLVQTEDWKPIATEVAHPGTPELIVAPVAPVAPAATTPAGAGSGSGSGSATVQGPAAPFTRHTTGSPADGTHNGVAGGGGAPAGATQGSAALAPGGHAP